MEMKRKRVCCLFTCECKEKVNKRATCELNRLIIQEQFKHLMSGNCDGKIDDEVSEVG